MMGIRTGFYENMMLWIGVVSVRWFGRDGGIEGAFVGRGSGLS